MTLRANLASAARRAFVGVARATLAKADDSKKWQEVTLKGEGGRTFSNVEMPHPYGMTSVPKPPSDDQHNEAAEAIVLYLDGDMSHPIALVIGDRRYRLKNLKSGEFAIHDDQGQQVYLSRDRVVVHSSKEVHAQVAGKAHALLTADKAKLQFDTMSVTCKAGKVLLGSETGATHAVMTEDGPSTKVFAVISESDGTMADAAVGSSS
jgi:phage gp45-like